MRQFARAEQLQAKSEQIVDKGRRAMAVVLPIIALMLVYLGWLLLR